ncbi:MAG: polyprenyl synthetase family protein [Oscillospiraceae bacterium]|nr:polyprenyl synthetase family protein [Oscillospiraceae bacterium]
MQEDAIFFARLAEDAARVNDVLAQVLPAEGGTVNAAARYSLGQGGKRIRPVLTLAFCRLHGGDPAQALPLAAALELIHTYSLIHDDLPCMDDDNVRRGQPACHRAYGEAYALLAGDALLTRAFGVIAEAALPAETRAAAAALLAEAAGTAGMIGGQELDLRLEGGTPTAALLRELDRKKTGALLRAACQLGCLAAGADESAAGAADRYAEAIGLLFQVVDDILDVAGDSAATGKPTGSDEAKQKSTWVRFLGLAGARTYAAELASQADAALAGYGPAADFLRKMARWMETREK